MYIMEGLKDWFPYESFRPYQEEMLNTAGLCVERGGICLIDAPTGSGKSSVISALLAKSNGKKIIVAVRTISQLNIFLRELELIRKKHSRLKVAYLVGKRNMCPMGVEGDVYRMCEGLKAFSSSLMRDRAHKGSLAPANDPVIKNQLKRQDRDHPLLCPYFIKSRVFIENDGLKMTPSNLLRTKAEQVSKALVPPERVQEMCGELCPYEVMLQGARDADVILMNFHHLFSETIREQMYQSLNIEPSQAILLIDEAHNCGDTIQSIQSVSISERTVELSQNELSHMRGKIGGVESVAAMLPQVTAFMESLRRSTKSEDWFDPVMFSKFLLRGSIYNSLDDIVDDLLRIYEAIREKKFQEGDFREIPTERIMEFFLRILQAGSDPAYLSIYRKDDDMISLRVQNIDPSSTLRDIAGMHAAVIMISGTLSPVESFRKLYFREADAITLSLPNAFPKENRLVFCAGDITSAYSMRKDKENHDRILGYIKAFAGLKGNLAVYFPSYELLNIYSEDLPQRFSQKEVFIESQDTATAAADLKKFLSLPDSGKSGIIFGVCGGKWSEGLDYRGELLNGALVIGLPLAPYNEVRRMIIQYFKNRFGDEGEFISYTLPAINKALQALGRVLRTPEDTGALVLGESRFLDRQVKKGLPEWMQKELIECNLSSFVKDIERWR